MKIKEENTSIKASNDNHIYINEKLNKALAKYMKKSVVGNVKTVGEKKEEQDLGTTGGSLAQKQETDRKIPVEDGSFGGDLSSIMIAPMDQEHV